MENFSSIARAWEDITLDNYLDTLEDEVEEELKVKKILQTISKPVFMNLLTLPKKLPKEEW